MAEELLVVLNKNDPTCGLGFSLLGTPGLPPIIYDIVENSPAAESGKANPFNPWKDLVPRTRSRIGFMDNIKNYDLIESKPNGPKDGRLLSIPDLKVEAGDVILKVNETEVNRLNTKEVLKCLRLCENPVSLILKRDPVVKAKVRHFLSTPVQFRGDISLSDLISETSSLGGCSNPRLEPGCGDFSGGSEPPPVLHPLPLESVTRTNGESGSGDDTPNGGTQQPKFEAFVMTGDRVLKICRTQQGSVLPKQQRKVDSLRNNMHPYNNHQRHASVPTSPVEADRHPAASRPKVGSASTSPTPTAACGGVSVSAGASYVVRTSKSEDHLQSNKDSMSAVSIDIDDDVTSSLNTLLDTRQDSENEDQRIVWTYNAPHSDSSSTRTTSSSNNISPARPDSPASPTSVSSSVMSSSSSSGGELGDKVRLTPMTEEKCLNPLPTGGDLSQSEAISNISSPDFQEEDSEIIGKDLVMEVSDPSDSDSTLLVSDHTKRQHRIVIQVEGRDNNNKGVCDNNNKESYISHVPGEQTSSYHDDTDYDPEDEDVDDENLVRLTEGAANLAKSVSPPPALPQNPPPPSSGEDDSDVDSLSSYHYSPKGVDLPSAVRLAKRLYMMDGFKKSDVSRHLCKNNEFSRAVAEEYLKYFSFTNDSLDGALRKFLTQFCLTGETQERERVLVHFSKRYLDCNPGQFTSQDAVHTLTCAIMLLNTDMHGQNIGRKMTCNEFIDNLAELNDGENFPREILKNLYQSIKNNPLEWAMDDETEDPNLKSNQEREDATGKVLFDVPSSTPAVEYKKGYVMRKCCVEPNGKKTPLGKRGWKMYYCTLRDLVLYLHKDEHGFRKTQLSDNLHNAIRIHHSLATKANDYTKKLHVFRLETADQAVYLFQTSDSKELQSWIDTINYVTASFSAPPLPGAVGSQRRFQRPLLPSSQTRLNLREQLRDHENLVMRLESELEQHRKHPPERGAKQLILYNFREKDNYLQYELKRYKLYVYLLRSRMSQLPDMIEGSHIESIGESAEEGNCGEERRAGSPASNRVRKQGANSAS